MRLVQDPAGLWIGRPPLMARKVAGDRPPVAIADARAVDPDGPAVRIPVMENDVDPEGGALTLVSAYAALGAATVDGAAVRYAPPQGVTGTDTIVYEIVDAAGQTDAGQIAVALGPVALSAAATADNRIEITAADADLTLMIDAGAPYAGETTLDAGLLSDGPVNLVPPSFTGDATTPGATLTAVPGFWAHDAATTPVGSWQWRRDGVAIAGATGATRLLDAADAAGTVTVVETMTDALGSRSMDSSGFLGPAEDPGLIAWWDADDAASMEVSGGAVSAWHARGGAGTLSMTSGPDRPLTGGRSLNGRNVLDFDGGDHLTGALTLPADGDVAFHAVVAIDAVSSAFAALISVDAARDFQLDAGSAGAFDGQLNATGIGTSVALSGGPFAGNLIVSIIFDRTESGTAGVFVDGQSRASMSYVQALDSAQTLKLMTNRSANAAVDGAVGELIVTASTGNRAAYHTYLATKWGLT